MRRPTNWKKLFTSNEFIVFVIVVVGLGIMGALSGCSTSGGYRPIHTADSCGPDAVWTCRTHGAYKECACLEKTNVQDQLGWEH
jgi:hypothetical protein